MVDKPFQGQDVPESDLLIHALKTARAAAEGIAVAS